MSTVTRLKQLVARQGGLMAVVLLLVAAAAIGGAALAYTSPTTTTVTEQTAQQSVSTDVTTNAVVTGNTTLYPAGSRLEDMPAYLLSASPDVTFTVRTTVPSGQPVDVVHQLAVVSQASRDGEPFYTRRRPLINQSVRTTDGFAAAAATMNVSEFRNSTRRTQGQIGDVGTFQTRVELVVTYRTDRYQGELAADTPLVISGGAYWLGGALSASQQHSTPQTRQVTQPPDPVSYLSLVGLALVALVGAGATLFGRRSFDADALEAELVRTQYDEWISTGEFPTGTDKRYTSITTLEGLVDVAIDSNKRVLYDDDLDIYAVVDGDLVYYYSPDPFDIDAWLDT